MLTMTAIQVKQVPDDLHDAVRQRAAEQGMTVGEYVLSLLREDLALPTQDEWFGRLARRKPVSGVDAVAVRDAARLERGEELGAARRR